MTDCLAGRLRHRVTLQTLSTASDGQGGQTETWADAATLWAAVEPLKGYEKLQAMQVETPVTHRVTLRYRAVVTTAMRLVFRGRVLAIKEVIDENEARVTLRLTCVET